MCLFFRAHLAFLNRLIEKGSVEDGEVAIGLAPGLDGEESRRVSKPLKYLL